MILPRSRAMTRPVLILNATVLVAAVLSIGQVRYDLHKRDAAAAGNQAPGFGTPTPGSTVPGAAAAPGASATPSAGAATPSPGATTGPGGTTLPGSTTGTTGGPVPGTPRLPDFGLLDQGVTKTSVLIGADYDKTGCGGSGSLSTQFGAATTGDPEKSFAAFVRYINETGGIRGRTLKLVTVDDGGLYCPERHQAAALELVDQHKVFMDIAGLHEVSDLLAKRHLPFYGGRATKAEQNQQGNGQFQLYQDAEGDFANWAAFGRNYLHADKNQPCLIHPDTPDFNNLETYINKAMAKQGLKFGVTIRYADDPSTAQQQATTASVKMKATCKSVWLIANNALADVFFTNAAFQQQWFPQWTWTARTNGIDFALSGRLMQQNEWANSIGLSTRIKPGISPYDGQCARIYDRYNSGDGQDGSAAVEVACNSILTVSEAMRRAVDRTGVLTSDSLMLGVDAIRGDFSWDAFVPLTYDIRGPGQEVDRTGYDLQTVAHWNTTTLDYDFPEFPKYWKVLGSNGAGWVDIRPYLTKKYVPPKKK